MAMTRASRNVGLRTIYDPWNPPDAKPTAPYQGGVQTPMDGSRSILPATNPEAAGPRPTTRCPRSARQRRLRVSAMAAAARARSRATSRRPRLTNRAAGSCRRLCLPPVQAASGASCPAPSSPPSSPARQLQLPQQLLLARRSRTPSPPSPRPTRTRRIATARRWGRSILAGSWAGSLVEGARPPSPRLHPRRRAGPSLEGARGGGNAPPDMSGITFDQNGNPIWNGLDASVLSAPGLQQQDPTQLAATVGKPGWWKPLR